LARQQAAVDEVRGQHLLQRVQVPVGKKYFQ
jgi:hypothetical protein